MKPFITAVIPTYNRCRLLKDAIESIQNQSVASADYEIIVVDNASTDDTKQVVEAANQSGKKKVEYLYESRQGLHWARHAAAKKAKGEILLYTDDDAVATSDWIKEMISPFEDPQVAVVGGPIHVRWLTLPDQLVSTLKIFGHLDLGSEPLFFKWPNSPHGGNYAVRKEALFKAGGFDPDTSYEDKLVGDGENGLSRKIYQMKLKIAYSPKALIYHVQDGASMNDSRICHKYAQQGRFEAYQNYKLKRYGKGELLLKLMTKMDEALSLKLKNVLKRLRFCETDRLTEFRSAFLFAEAFYYLRMLYSKKFREIVLRDDWIHGL